MIALRQKLGVARKDERGFTLPEVLTTITILGILLAIGIIIWLGLFECNSSNGFKGVMIITGNGTTTGTYGSSGNDTVEGFVIADGNMTIRGTVAPFTVTEDLANRPGFFGVKLWSWRECYSTTCN